MKTKKCSKCNQLKPINEFYKRTDAKDGLTYECKNCKNSINENWRLKNLDKKHDCFKNWVKNNPEKAVEIRKRSDRKQQLKNFNELSDTYVSKQLKRGNIKSFTPEIIETKRLIISIKREINHGAKSRL